MQKSLTHLWPWFTGSVAISCLLHLSACGILCSDVYAGTWNTESCSSTDFHLDWNHFQGFMWNITNYESNLFGKFTHTYPYLQTALKIRKIAKSNNHGNINIMTQSYWYISSKFLVTWMHPKICAMYIIYLKQVSSNNAERFSP